MTVALCGLIVGVVATPPTTVVADPPALARIHECGLRTPSSARDPEGFDALWQAAGAGWSGGDATFSERLPDGRVIWLFGDSFIGGLRADGERDPATPMVRNSLVVQDGDCLTTVLGGTRERPDAYFTAPDGEGEEWYWPNQPIARARDVVVFLTRMVRTGPGDWHFAVTGTAMATLSLPRLDVVDLRPVGTPPGIYMGSALLQSDGFTYVFGVDGRTQQNEVHIARVRGDLTAGAWQYWAGSSWSSRPEASKPVLHGVASQFSVVRARNGELVLLSQDGLQPRVVSFRAPAPWGPWRAGPDVARIPSIPGGWTYNATAHPEYADHDQLLLSYNVSPLDPGDVHRLPSLYRPRFLSIPLALDVRGYAGEALPTGRRPCLKRGSRRAPRRAARPCAPRRSRTRG